ncbi:MAG: glutathione S-transferase family protein [Polyangiaceae bacterium]|nr:glutathione S-transferase family protein [Polyangiaceae bacterium]
MIKLYFAPRTRATRPRWLLEQLGVPYELVNVDLEKGEQKQLPYLRIHPLGKVPALVDDDVVVFESIAICMYLADKYIDKKLAPALGTPERAQYYQWMLFAAATLEPAVADYYEQTQGLPAEKRSPEATAKAKERALAAIKVVEHAMLGKMYLVAEKLSAVDIVVGSVMRWAESMKLLEGAPDLASWLYELKSHAAFKKAMA